MQICASFGVDSRQVFDALTLKIRHYIREHFPPACPRCHSEDIVKDGKARRKNIPDVQMFLCKRCGKKFCERVHTPFYRKHYPAGFIMTMAWLFYERGSMHWIAGAFAINPPYKTLHGWITDGWDGYKNAIRWLGIQHRSVNRSQEGFVSEDGIHANHMECLWNLVRRWLETARGLPQTGTLQPDASGLHLLP